MAISMYNLKKWIKMLSGNSILHVNQDVGRIYSITEIRGYYNDLTKKITKSNDSNQVKLPLLRLENGNEIYFSISIFQYGLAAYDLYLLEGKKIYLEQFKASIDWACENQQNDGSWSTFYYNQPEHPFSSMAQGEGISLLVRAYKEFKDDKYRKATEKAVNFLITPIETGGTTKYVNNEVFLLEYTNKPAVLNGWIFSLFGLYDYLKLVDNEEVNDIYSRSVQTLVNHMESFDNGFWSKYDMGNMITSPFYHKLHIAQLKVLYEITEEDIFRKYFEKWTLYSKNKINKTRAFILKAFQKIVEK